MNSELMTITTTEMVSISADEARNRFITTAAMAIIMPIDAKRAMPDMSRLTTVASVAMPKNTAAVPPNDVMISCAPFV